jgi:hypothetical protein
MTEYDSKTVLQLQNLLCERQIVFKKKEKKASLIRLLTVSVIRPYVYKDISYHHYCFYIRTMMKRRY